MINKQNGDVIGYMALNSDSFILDSEEKHKENIDIPFNALPAIKIGKLAVDLKYKDKPYGSFLLWLSVGYLERMNQMGIGCRFLTVDADISENPETPGFYSKNGFVPNEAKGYRNRTRTVSMRYDAFQD